MQVKLVLLSLDVGEFRESLIERGLKLGVLGLQRRELGGQRQKLVFEKRTSLLSGDAVGICGSLDGIKLRLQASDVLVSPSSDVRCIVGVTNKVVVGDEDGHDFALTETKRAQ